MKHLLCIWSLLLFTAATLAQSPTIQIEFLYNAFGNTVERRLVTQATSSGASNSRQATDSSHTTQHESQVRIYPNPVETAFEIQITTTQDVQSWKYEMMDAGGKKILSQTSADRLKKVGMQDMPSGPYYLQVYLLDQVLNFKVIKK